MRIYTLGCLEVKYLHGNVIFTVKNATFGILSSVLLFLFYSNRAHCKTVFSYQLNIFTLYK